MMSTYRLRALRRPVLRGPALGAAASKSSSPPPVEGMVGVSLADLGREGTELRPGIGPDEGGCAEADRPGIEGGVPGDIEGGGGVAYGEAPEDPEDPGGPEWLGPGGGGASFGAGL